MKSLAYFLIFLGSLLLTGAILLILNTFDIATSNAKMTLLIIWASSATITGLLFLFGGFACLDLHKYMNRDGVLSRTIIRSLDKGMMTEMVSEKS
jgi:hypothetical protein